MTSRSARARSIEIPGRSKHRRLPQQSVVLTHPLDAGSSRLFVAAPGVPFGDLGELLDHFGSQAVLLRPREEVDRSVMGELADMETGLRLCSQHACNIRRYALESESRVRRASAATACTNSCRSASTNPS